MQHLTPFGWLTLCLFTGVVGAIGQLFCKNAGKVMPPYVIIGVIGVMWAVPPVLLMSVGPAYIGAHAVMSLGQASSLGLAVIGPVLVVGLLFWLDNLARFDAVNKAPYVAYVLMLIELSAMVAAFFLELGLKMYRKEALEVSAYELGGVVFALISTLCFRGPLFGSRQEVVSDRVHFTPFSWQTLCIAAGILAAVGQLLGKEAGKVMPPYVLTGIVGGIWVTCSVIYMSLGSTWKRVGMPSTMSLRAMVGLGAAILLPVLAAGFLFWIENLSRFDAINKAPLLGYVLVAIPFAAGASALVLEWIQKWWKSEHSSIGRYEIGGLLFAAVSIALFATAPARTL